MSFMSAKAQLTKYGLEDRIMEFSDSSATVSEAASDIGCKEAEIAKTMAFQVEEHPILIVTAGDVKIDNSKFKAEFHTKAKMIPFSDVETVIGHVAGGVCPFGILDGVEVYLSLIHI